MRDVVVGMLERPGETPGLQRHDLVARGALGLIQFGAVTASAGFQACHGHGAFPLACYCCCDRVVRNRQPRAGDGAGMAAKLGDHDVAGGDADVVDSGPAAARNFPRGRDQHVAELARPDEGDVALRGDRALVAGVAGKGEGGIGQQEDEAAMGDALAVDHVRRNRHRQRRLAGLDLDNLHAEALAGVVFLPHRIRAGAGEVVGRKRDVHSGMPALRDGSTTFSPCAHGPVEQAS